MTRCEEITDWQRLADLVEATSDLFVRIPYVEEQLKFKFKINTPMQNRMDHSEKADMSLV